tara:strand:+ start:256 stop:489 length:234 start_codon:yes stop_codon:yes gene_type:complete
MIAYKLTDLDGREHVVDGIVQRGDLMFATAPENGDIPIYSIKYNNEFARYYKDHIENNENLRDSGQGDNYGAPRGPH